MVERNCAELMDPETMAARCRQPGEQCKKRWFDCMTELFFGDFKNIFRRRTVASTLDTDDEQLAIAFHFGLTLFYNHIKAHGWEEKGAGLRTAVFRYCSNQLWQIRTDILRDNNRRSGVDPEKVMALLSSPHPADGPESLSPEQEILRAAFLRLGKRCRHFLVWRKLKLVSDEQMKRAYPDVDWSGRNPDDMVYRCFVRLKELVDEIRKGHDNGLDV